MAAATSRLAGHQTAKATGLMKALLFTINNALLFLCVSMYLGTGWSMVLFCFHIAPQLTVDNYYLELVPAVEAATQFFTIMTKLMIASCVVMIVAEWRTWRRWLPVTVLATVIAATVLTIYWIFPHNAAMKAGIKNPVVLRQTLEAWMALNKIRVGLWSVQWMAMMIYFAVPADRGKGTQ